MITCSIEINRFVPALEVWINRGRFDGTFTRAKSSSPSVAPFRTTAIFKESPEIYGNGWEGSTASGVKTGKILFVKIPVTYTFSSSESFSHVIRSIPFARRAGKTDVWKQSDWR